MMNPEPAPPKLSIQNQTTLLKIEDSLKGLILTSKTIDEVRKTFLDELESGLRMEPSSLQMANTYITELPDGTEEGKFLALDLGGTNFRVLLTEFRGGQMIRDFVRFYEISDDLRLGPGVPLFDYIASCVEDFLKIFLKDKTLENSEISLGPLSIRQCVMTGFTFSFPMIQNSLRSGILTSWTKSFNCEDVVGKDVVQLLKESLLKKKLCSNVSVTTVINDTTGTLLMGALLDKRTTIGLIVGTGSNACYVEKADRVQRWETPRRGETKVVIDVEWGAFGDNGSLDFIKTEFDTQVDDNSLLRNSFTFEKYISGKYLGEIVRVVVVKLINEGLLFGGKLSTLLDTPQSFLTPFVSDIEEDVANDKLNKTLQVLDCLQVKHYSADDVKVLQYVCSVVTWRSALLVSICLSVLIERSEQEEVVVAVDGSVFDKLPSFRSNIEKHVRMLTKKKFEFLRVVDGSGKGAAVAAAVADKLGNRSKDS